MHRRILITIALVVGTVAGAPLVSAEDDPKDTLRDAREQQEQARAERADLARELDVLEATDAQLIEALEVLNEQVVAQQLAVSAAEAAVLDALAAEESIQGEIELTQHRAADLRLAAQARVVAAYVSPRDSSSTERDITALARREALFRYVDLDGRDVLDQLREVEDDLDLLTLEAARRRDEAVSRQADLETALQQLNEDAAAEQRVRLELGEIIAEVEDELTAMADAEAQIVAIIRDAQREIARNEALAWAATSSTTTTSPTTTTSTVPSDAPPDGGSDQNPTQPGATTTTGSVTPVDRSNLSLIWPTTGRVTSGYGSRIHPITGSTRNHTGIDIDDVAGASVWAAQSGTVIFSGVMGGYGETVIIDHGSGVSTLYAHLSSRSATEGSTVGQGTEVGRMGATGFATGSHLHFEVRVDSSPVNPATYLP